MANSEQQMHNGQIHGNDRVSLETIVKILEKIGLNLVTKKFQDEEVDIKILSFIFGRPLNTYLQ